MVKLADFDSFGVEDMSGDEFESKQAYVTSKCMCQGCPSYVEGDVPIGYCLPLIGTSKKIKYEKDCLCTKCPIYHEYDLTHNHYCTRCSQVCQAYKAEVGGGHE